MTIDQLKAYHEAPKALREICKQAGLPYTTIHTKIRLNRELSAAESYKIRIAMQPAQEILTKIRNGQ